MIHTRLVSRPASPTHRYHHVARWIKTAQMSLLRTRVQPHTRLQNPSFSLGPLRFDHVTQEILDGGVVAIVGWVVCGPWCAGGGFAVGYVLSYLHHHWDEVVS